MITAAGSLELAQARLSARHGARADDALWRRIEHVREFVPLLDLLHGTPLARWVVGIGAMSAVHAIEATLRQTWREEVAATAAWMPECWQPSVRWWGSWPDVAVADHLGHDGAPLPWMEDDPLYRELVGAASIAPPGRSDTALRARTLRELGSTPRSRAAWCDGWRARLPDGAGEGALLRRLVRALEEHRVAFANAGATGGNALRRALQDRLRVLFRAATLDPALAFIHLTLAALEEERLRAELVRRVAFPAAMAA